MAAAMVDVKWVDSWLLSLISMWLDRNDSRTVENMIVSSFSFKELYSGVLALNFEIMERKKLGKTEEIPKKVTIPQDKGDQTDRISKLANSTIKVLKGFWNITEPSV